MDASILELIDINYRHIKSLTVCKNGNVIAGKLFGANDNGTKQATGCIFKTIITAAMGAAIRKGIIKDINSPVFPVIFPHRIDIEEKYKSITFKHALTKTTGLAWPGPGTGEDLFAKENLLALALNSIPGKQFEYKPDPQLVVWALSEAAGMPFLEFVKQTVFLPLNIKNYDWSDEFGKIESLRLLFLDILKLGELFLNHGIYDNITIFNKDFCEDALSSHIFGMFPEHAYYGYYWWSEEMHGKKVNYSSGFGGQYLCLVPDCALTILITSNMDRPHPENKELLKIIIADLCS